MENACRCQILEEGNAERVQFNIDRYSSFWSSFITCISPTLSSDDLSAVREELCNGDYSLDINFKIQDDHLYACTFNITEYHSQGEIKGTFSIKIFFTDIGTTQINGLDIPKEMQKKAELYRLDPQDY